MPPTKFSCRCLNLDLDQTTSARWLVEAEFARLALEVIAEVIDHRQVQQL